MSVTRSCFLSAISDWHLIFFPHCKRKMPSLSHILSKISSSVKCHKREKIIKSLLVLSFFAVFYMEVEKRLKVFYFSDAFQGEWLLGKCNRQLGINGTSYPFPPIIFLCLSSLSPSFPSCLSSLIHFSLTCGSKRDITQNYHQKPKDFSSLLRDTWLFN